jgi:Ser/Thr protein kinase RdoA (MazF antagonist)
MEKDRIDPHPVLQQYDIGAVGELIEAAGTAGRTWKVVAANGTYFLRLRGVRTANEKRLLFDQGLRAHLMARGVPTVCALVSTAGAPWVWHEGGAYELYPFVEGRAFQPDSQQQLVRAAQALAQFHQASADYTAPSAHEESIAQYTTLGFSPAESDRMDDPRLQKLNMLEVKKLAGNAAERAIVDRCIARVETLAFTYAGPAYERLAGWTIHGDYTPANLLFASGGNEVVGVFDFDWAVPGVRCRDVADGLYFFATRPRAIDPSDIWSLTSSAEFDRDRCAVFLKSYHAIAPLAVDEIAAIPTAFAGRWLSIRLEGMAKVHKDERFRFFVREIEKPLLWLDENRAYLEGQLG